MILFQIEYGVKTEHKDTNQPLFIFIINLSVAQFYNY